MKPGPGETVAVLAIGNISLSYFVRACDVFLSHYSCTLVIHLLLVYISL